MPSSGSLPKGLRPASRRSRRRRRTGGGGTRRIARGAGASPGAGATAAPAWRRWHATHRRECRLVARAEGEVVGWTALGSYSSRAVYSGVAWESVYVAASARGRGVGRALLEALVTAAEAAGVWTLMA